MTVRPLGYSADEHLQDVSFTMTRCNEDPQAVALVPELQPVYEALKDRIEKWSAKYKALDAAQAGLEIADEAVDETARNFHGVLLTELHHHRHEPKYLTYLPRGLNGVIKAAYGEEAVLVKSLAERCAADPSPRLHEQAALLGAAADQMSVALQRRSADSAEETTAYGELQIAKLGAIDALRRISGRLTDNYPHDRERVRSFFRVVRKPRPPKETQPVPVGAPVANGTLTPAA